MTDDKPAKPKRNRNPESRTVPVGWEKLADAAEIRKANPGFTDEQVSAEMQRLVTASINERNKKKAKGPQVKISDAAKAKGKVNRAKNARKALAEKNKKNSDAIPVALDPSIDLDIDNLPKPWNKKQFMFAMQYLAAPSKVRDGTRAAIEAGYAATGAAVQAHRLLRDANNRHIQDYINHRLQKVVEELKFSHEKHVAAQLALANSNIMDYFSVDPVTGMPFLDLSTMTREQGACISKIKIKAAQPITIISDGHEYKQEVLEAEITLWDKGGAQDRINKIQGLYAPEKHQHSGPNGGAMQSTVTLQNEKAILAAIERAESEC